jgi:hypothetical protein
VATPAVTERKTTRIREILDDLVHQRQSLRNSTSPDASGLLEANRRSIAYWQAELSEALLAERGFRERDARRD